MVEALFFSGGMLKMVQRHRHYPILLSLLSGIFFWLSWPPNRLAPLLLVVFVPLLLILRHVEKHRYQRPYWTFYKYTYWTLFLWNLTTTWWVAYSTMAGAIFMLFCNTFCMSLPLPLFQFTTRHLGKNVGYIALLAYWVSMEYMHLRWELSFPWLNLGNGLACWPEWVQWYAYTGALGGTVWILVANLLLFHFLSSKKTTTQLRLGGIAGFWIVLPMLISYYTYWNYEEQGKGVEVVVMQPNINPYTGEFVDMGTTFSAQERVARFIALSEIQLSEETQFLVWPEVAIDGLFDEQLMNEYSLIHQLVNFKRLHPQLSLLVGLNSLVGYGNEKVTKTARFSHRYGYYDIFNSALFVDDQGTLATYHKSKLVPGVELVPYLYNLEVPKGLAPDTRGRLSSLGIQDRPSVFFNQRGTGIAPIICYESVYGDYLTDFVRMGASLIFSMTVDGWWKDTPGYQQHFHYTRLRAIESRRSVARSALKGISAFINQRGDILQAAHYQDQAAMRYTLRANSALTFYVQHNNYIASTMLWTSLVLIIGAILSKVLARYTSEEGCNVYNTKNKHGSR
ncbi:MAG: apolipoprotein N-acyltransferase [Amoebophilaceae bacterium]|jgi:apolipoprotein N-acyltransferase|nr:apolipoprotein N-acyltransferase [Amoebophilaceae bacterium]